MGGGRHASTLTAQQPEVSWSDVQATSRNFTVSALMPDPFSLLISNYPGEHHLIHSFHIRLINAGR